MALCRDSFTQYLYLQDFRNTANICRSSSIRNGRGSSQSPAQDSFLGLCYGIQLNLRTRQKDSPPPKVHGKHFTHTSVNSTSQSKSKTDLSICCKCYPEMKGKKVQLLFYVNRLITKIQVNQDQRHLDYLICSLSCPSKAASYDRLDLMRQIYCVGI